MQSSAKTVFEYIKQLPKEKRATIEVIRKVIKKHLPQGYSEIMQYGMIVYVIPLKRYPSGYLNDSKKPLPYVALAAQKNYYALYVMAVYGDKKLYSWFQKEYKKTGKKMDMGKSCVRFKTLKDVPLELIGKVINRMSVAQFINQYEALRGKRKR
jgi:uncharacterized protein YdhG (YjbR/CyaY superfamily)